MLKDFFDMNDLSGMFDWVFEYVTICSVLPERIEELIRNIHTVLKPGGYFVTVLFPIIELSYSPPFRIDLQEFYKLSKKYFNLYYFQSDINSIRPRKGNEVLLIFRKKDI